MHTLIIDIESSHKAKELKNILTSLDFVKKISSVENRKAVIEALQEHEEMKSSILRNKNKAIAKYL